MTHRICYLLFLLSIVAIICCFIFFTSTKPYIDRYANHASVAGLVISGVGFVSTILVVVEAARTSKQAQEEVQKRVDIARTEARELIEKIRLRGFESACEQALFVATEARHAIRSEAWLRAAEKCDKARTLALRLLSSTDLSDLERTPIRAVVEDLRTTVAFIERNRLNKKQAPSGLPIDKLAPLDVLSEVLEQIQARLDGQLLGGDDDTKPTTRIDEN
jgi:hypothetical protein